MSFLPIIILIFMFLRNGSLSSVLQSVNIDDIKDTLKSFGIEHELLNLLSKETLEKVSSGDLKALLPLLPTILSAFNKNSNTYSNEFTTQNQVYEDLNPIKDIAGEVVTSTFGNYFK